MRNALLALIMLTQLDGNPIWVESSAIVIIKPSFKQCHGGGAAIRVNGTGLCVKETADEVREKRDAK